jgi:hypothetical protein
MLVFGLDGGGILSFSRAFDSVDREEVASERTWLAPIEKVRAMLGGAERG